MIPEDGLLPQLEEGLTLFYAGLSALSAAQGQGLDEAPDVTRDIVVDGIPVSVTDTVEGSLLGAAAGAAGSEGAEGAGGARPRLVIEVLNDAAAAAAAAAAAGSSGAGAAAGSEQAGEMQQQREAEHAGS
jgi:hypothetical protein